MSDLKLKRTFLHILHTLNMSNFRFTSLFSCFYVPFNRLFTLKQSCGCFQNIFVHICNYSQRYFGICIGSRPGSISTTLSHSMVAKNMVSTYSLVSVNAKYCNLFYEYYLSIFPAAVSLIF